MWRIRKIIANKDYDIAVVPEHPKSNRFGYVPLHRIIWENHNNRRIPPNHHIHHVNGNKKDNRPQNLVLMSHTDHARLHADLIIPKYVMLDCPKCGKTFAKRNNQYTTKAKHGQTKFYCSRDCYRQSLTEKRGPRGSFKHGTKVGYSFHKCRCDKCREYQRNSIRKYRKAKRDE